MNNNQPHNNSLPETKHSKDAIPPVGSAKATLNQRKLRIIIITGSTFFALNAVIFCAILIFCSSEEKQPQAVEIVEFASDVQDEESVPPPQRKECKANTTAEGASSVKKPVIKIVKETEDSIPPLDTASRTSFEDSFFRLYEVCPDIRKKEKCLFVFLILHIYYAEKVDQLASWSGCRPMGIIQKFSKEISDDGFELFEQESLSKQQKDEKEQYLSRITESIQAKFTQNRRSPASGERNVPHTLHFELSVLVRENPALGRFLNEALEKYE